MREPEEIIVADPGLRHRLGRQGLAHARPNFDRAKLAELLSRVVAEREGLRWPDPKAKGQQH
jgi:hypothetical protein